MAGTGGKRNGAGRKPGSRNKRSVALQAAIAASGETPLDYMLRVMRDETAEEDRRDEMAKAAAPYVHPKLASTELKGSDDRPVTFKFIMDISGPQ